MTCYQPISCDLHSQLELAIMHEQHLQIEFVQADERLSLTIKPLDIIARKDKGEFLIAENESGQTMEIRLDKLLSFTEL